MWYTKNSFKKTAQQGEWWITDSGAEYADGDVGDTNHAMIAENHILNSLGYDLSDGDDGLITTENANSIMNDIHEYGKTPYSPYWEDFVQYAQQEFANDNGNPWWYNVTYDDYIQWLHSKGLPEKNRMPQSSVTQHLEGLRSDPIQYVIKNYQWIRVHGNNVELYDLDDTTTSNLASGLYEANDEDVENMNFNIHVNKHGRTLMNVPYSEIEDGSVKKRLFQEKQLPPEAPLRKQLQLPFEDETLRRLYRHPGAKTNFNFKKYSERKSSSQAYPSEDYDFMEHEDNAESEVYYDFKRNPSARQAWTVVPAARLIKIWTDYSKYGFVRDEKGLDEIANIMIQNTLKLKANTIFGEHTEYTIEDLSDKYDDLTPELIEMFMDHITDDQGQWRLSDYALTPLMNDAEALFKAKTANKKIYIIDRMLNRVHARSDIAALFVEGGSKTLTNLQLYGANNVV